MKKTVQKENTAYGLTNDTFQSTITISANKKMAAVLRNEDILFHISSCKCES
jgi:hypothetical protein